MAKIDIDGDGKADILNIFTKYCYDNKWYCEYSK